VRIVANASVGLDQRFLQVLHDNSDASMTSIRWQRFTSDQGVTRQFPAVFDDSGRDQRLEPWYCLTTQVAMRVMLVLDMSDSMRHGGAMNIAKLAVFTILSTLKPHDSVNVLLIAGSTPGLPSFCPDGLMPASASNIARLREWVERALVMGKQTVSLALSAALGHLNVVDISTPVVTAEVVQENIKNFVFVVSDGELDETDLALGQPPGRTLLDSIYDSIKPQKRSLVPSPLLSHPLVRNDAGEDSMKDGTRDAFTALTLCHHAAPGNMQHVLTQHSRCVFNAVSSTLCQHAASPCVHMPLCQSLRQGALVGGKVWMDRKMKKGEKMILVYFFLHACQVMMQHLMPHLMAHDLTYSMLHTCMQRALTYSMLLTRRRTS
jgi:hypothetical protein